MTPLGCHIIGELTDCPRAELESVERVETLMLAAVQSAGATIVNHTFHQFNPIGVSGVVVIAESHVTIHTWPELAYAAVDAFTCGDGALAQRIVDELRRNFSAGHADIRRIDRGPIAPCR